MAARRGRPPSHRGALGRRLERYPGGLQALAAASGVSAASVYRLAAGGARKIAWEQLGMLAHAIARADGGEADDVHAELIELMGEDLAAAIRTGSARQ